MTPRTARRPTVPALLSAVAVAAVLGSTFSGCTKHDGLILLDLRSSGPYAAPVVHIRMSAKGWTTRTVSGSIGPEGFLVGYYGPAKGGPVTAMVEALDGDDCVLGRGSGTVAALASGATSDPITVFVRPVAGNGCTVVDAGSDAGGQDAGGEDSGDNDASADAGVDSGSDAPGDAETDAGDAAAPDADPDAGGDATAD
jgi:hypothetical protein